MDMRWGGEPGYCVVGGQKIPVQRPRVRDTRKHEVPLGSYELLQRASLMEESVFQKIMHGITTRRYSAVIKELETAYGIESRPSASTASRPAGSGWKNCWRARWATIRFAP